MDPVCSFRCCEENCAGCVDCPAGCDPCKFTMEVCKKVCEGCKDCPPGCEPCKCAKCSTKQCKSNCCPTSTAE
uniref:Metallothionein 1 n=1 Tax=Oikopleura dioica TaxID=34765 RepID=A0A510C3X3_OIKDI|nr:metallothionein 1 [Oikopleura dioica]